MGGNVAGSIDAEGGLNALPRFLGWISWEKQVEIAGCQRCWEEVVEGIGGARRFSFFCGGAAACFLFLPQVAVRATKYGGEIWGFFVGKDGYGRELSEFGDGVVGCPLRPLEVRFKQHFISSHVTCHKIRYLQITDPRGRAGQRLEQDLHKK